jgi:hypothetical protein
MRQRVKVQTMQTARYQNIETAVRDLEDSSRPGTFYMGLRKLTLSLLSEGYSREELLDAYAQIARELSEVDEESEDDVLEVMAELEGWCAPHAQL